MRTVELKDLENKLNEYVRLAAAGETILITYRDREVAELVPPRQGRSSILVDAALAEAVRKGWMTPPTIVDSEPPPRAPVGPLAEILDGLSRDRTDR